jgi:hypothetical protein
MAESVTDFNCSRSEQIFQFKNSRSNWPSALECSSNIVREPESRLVAGSS